MWIIFVNDFRENISFDCWLNELIRKKSDFEKKKINESKSCGKMASWSVLTQCGHQTTQPISKNVFSHTSWESYLSSVRGLWVSSLFSFMLKSLTGYGNESTFAHSNGNISGLTWPAQTSKTNFTAIYFDHRDTFIPYTGRGQCFGPQRKVITTLYFVRIPYYGTKNWVIFDRSPGPNRGGKGCESPGPGIFWGKKIFKANFF